MNKLFFIIFLFSVMFLFCSELSNPFDSKSPNYLSDTTINRIFNSYDSTFIDTTVLFDTVIYIDTVIHVRDSIHITTQIHFDTTIIFDTVNDTVYHFFDDTLYDTLHDTLHDTLLHIDTTYYSDTSHFQFTDTFYQYDTLVYLDTITDTVRFYRTQPFLYLIDLSDSSIFTTFNYGSSYNLAVGTAGIDPSSILNYSILEPSDFLFIPHSPPWLHSFNSTNSVTYTLKITTDSGSFANRYALSCNPSSILRGSKPVFESVFIYTGDYKKHFKNNYVPVCTLWTDSLPFSYYSDHIFNLAITPYFTLPGSSSFDYYISKNGSYDINNCRLYDACPGEYEFIIDEMYPGTNTFTITCRSVSPDTSLWSPWLSMVFIVLDGR